MARNAREPVGRAGHTRQMLWTMARIFYNSFNNKDEAAAVKAVKQKTWSYFYLPFSGLTP